MENTPFKRRAANDNYTPEELARAEQAVERLPVQMKSVEQNPEIDGTKFAALKGCVTKVETDYPFLVSEFSVYEALRAVSNLSSKDIINMINAVDTTSLEDSKASFYKALIHRVESASPDLHE